MRITRFAVLTASAVLVFSLSAMAQVATRPGGGVPTAPNGSTPNTPMKNGRQACARQAGVSQATMEKRRSMQEQTRSQVEGVCNNSSLSAEQKAQQIHEIRQNARKEEEGLLTPTQLSSLESCEKSLRAEHPNMHPATHTGPCGEEQ